MGAWVVFLGSWGGSRRAGQRPAPVVGSQVIRPAGAGRIVHGVRR